MVNNLIAMQAEIAHAQRVAPRLVVGLSEDEVTVVEGQ
jgi:hypothetical protein